MRNASQYPADQFYTSPDWEHAAQVSDRRATLRGAVITNRAAADAFIRVRDTADGEVNDTQGKRFWLIVGGTDSALGPLSLAMSEIFKRGIYIEAFTDYSATTPFSDDLDISVSYIGSGKLPAPPGFPIGATHYWNLNVAGPGTAPDSIGSLDFTLGAGVSQVSGALDNAIEVNNAVAGWFGTTATSPALLNVFGATISWWQKGTLDPEGYNAVGQYTAYSVGNEAFSWEPDDGANPSLLAVGDDSTVAFTSVVLSQPTDSSWHNYVARRSSDGVNLDLFVDGVQVATQDVSAVTQPASDLPIVVGEAAGSNPAKPVQLSDLGYWPRPLTDEEITTLHNGGTPLRPS